MSEFLLGSEEFIDTIVAKDGNIAQKAVAKIKSLKAMFERLGNAEALEEYKFLKKAENLYLKAAEKAGDAHLIRYINSGESDEEDRYDKKHIYRFNYDKVYGLKMSQRQISAFSRILSDKTKNMQLGETRLLYISDNVNGYYVLADGYLRCDIIKVFRTMEGYKKAKKEVEEYKNAYRDTEVFDSWANVVPFERRGRDNDSSMLGSRGGSESNDRVFVRSSRGDEGGSTESIYDDYDEEQKRIISEVIKEGTDDFVGSENIDTIKN